MIEVKSPFAPLKSHLFLAIWIAAMASNVGTWVQSVGEKWLMAEITRSPLLMSLIETGATLPMLLLGATWAFALNAVSFIGVLVVLKGWKRQPVTTDLPAERFVAAMKVGLRYSRHRRALQVILLRGAGFVFFGGPIFSLLPTLAIHHLNMGSTAFGLLLGCIGTGAVGATLILPALKERISPNTLLAVAMTTFAGGLLILAYVVHAIPVALALLVCGAGWLTVLSTCNTGVQLSVPSWVRARALGVYITAWGGAMAGGAAFWGLVGERWGIHAAFASAGIGMLLMLACTAHLKIQALEEPLDMSPYHLQAHAPEAIRPEEGPILTVLEYRVHEDHKTAFQDAMREVRRIRDGAVRWSLFQDLALPEPGILRFTESFLSSSWGEHLRLHHRATVEDRAVFRRAYALGTEPKPRIRHLVAAWDDRDSILDRIFE